MDPIGNPFRYGGEVIEAVQALIRAVLAMDPIYTETWIRLTVTQQNSLRAVLRESGKGLTSAAVVRTIGASPSTVQRALESTRASCATNQPKERADSLRRPLLRSRDPHARHG
jgi:hypothetical protein